MPIKKLLVACLAFLAAASAALAQDGGGVSASDPYKLRYCCGTAVDGSGSHSDNFAGNTYKQTLNLNARNAPIDPAKKTLILIGKGQSNWTSVLPTLYIPANAAVIDQFNVFDGSGYDIQDSLLGCTYSPVNRSIKGNILAMLADKAIPTFDRVIIVCLAIGGTTIDEWATGDPSSRLDVAMQRLAARGITPSTTGTTWALIFGQGEGENGVTSQAAWTASFATLKANILATGFNGRIFVPQETMNGGVTWAPVRAAQAAVVDNISVFSLGDFDTLTGLTNRQPGLTHLNDTGGAAGATIGWNAMHASGAPY